MEIEITKTFEDLGVTYREGERLHVAVSVAERFFQAKVAKRHTHKNYLEWLDAEQAAHVAAQPADVRNPVAKWGIRFLEDSRKWVIVRTFMSEYTLYGENALLDRKGRPDPKGSLEQFVANVKRSGCPDNIIDAYKKAKSAPDFLAAEAARREQAREDNARQQERDKHTPKFI